MKVTLIKLRGMPVSVCVEGWAFPVEKGKLLHAEDQRIGAKIKGKEEEYLNAFDLAHIAWELQDFDATENN